MLEIIDEDGYKYEAFFEPKKCAYNYIVQKRYIYPKEKDKNNRVENGWYESISSTKFNFIDNAEYQVRIKLNDDVIFEKDIIATENKNENIYKNKNNKKESYFGIITCGGTILKPTDDYQILKFKFALNKSDIKMDKYQFFDACSDNEVFLEILDQKGKKYVSNLWLTSDIENEGYCFSFETNFYPNKIKNSNEISSFKPNETYRVKIRTYDKVLFETNIVSENGYCFWKILFLKNFFKKYLLF